MANGVIADCRGSDEGNDDFFDEDVFRVLPLESLPDDPISIDALKYSSSIGGSFGSERQSWSSQSRRITDGFGGG